MIGRADIEGSKSNVAMGAWLPQASSLIPRDLMLSFPTALTSPPLGVSVFLLPLVTISSGSSMYLRPCKDPHLTMRWTAQCLLRLYPSRLLIIQSPELSPVLLKVLHEEALSLRLAFGALRTSQHPGVSLVHSPLAATTCSRELQYLIPQTFRYCLTWQRWGSLPGTDDNVVLIPVVTFLTPLA